MHMLLLLVPMVAFASVRLVVNINVAGSLENPHMPMQSLVTPHQGLERLIGTIENMLTSLVCVWQHFGSPLARGQG